MGNGNDVLVEFGIPDGNEAISRHRTKATGRLAGPLFDGFSGTMNASDFSTAAGPGVRLLAFPEQPSVVAPGSADLPASVQETGAVRATFGRPRPQFSDELTRLTWIRRTHTFQRLPPSRNMATVSDDGFSVAR